MKKGLSLILLLFLLTNCGETEPVNLQWNPSLNKEIFVEAKDQDKLVLLNLEANWCHWCHVMEDSTYANSEVRAYLNEHFILVKADQDANPDLAARYRKYGWPATIVLNAQGEDVWKNAGFIDPENFLEILSDLVAHPNPKRIKKQSALLNSGGNNFELQQRLRNKLRKALDFEKGGFKSAQKSIDGETFEFVFFHVQNGSYGTWIDQSLKGAEKLCDPEWGGVYQYSTYGDWEHLHFEKLLHIQARYLHLFAYDYAYTQNAISQKKAQEMLAYCDRFLKQKSGLYGNAQDADLHKGDKATDYFSLSKKKREKLGIPAIDTNTYTFSNAEWATSLLHWYAATGDPDILASVKKIEEGLLKRKDPNGLFRHGYKPSEIYTLRDNIPLLNYFIEASKLFPFEITYRKEALELGENLLKNFRLPDGTFQSYCGDNGLKPTSIMEENIRLARLLNWVGKNKVNDSFLKAAKDIQAYLCSNEMQKELGVEPGILSLMEENESEMNHFVYLSDSINTGFWRKAYALAPFYTSFAQIKTEEKNLPQNGMFRNATNEMAFICTSTFCSSPLKTKEDLLNFYGIYRLRI